MLISNKLAMQDTRYRVSLFIIKLILEIGNENKVTLHSPNPGPGPGSALGSYSSDAVIRHHLPYMQA